jgi:transposase
MMGKAKQSDSKLFYHGLSIERRLPQEHPLRRIKQLVDFDFARSRVEHLYGINGHISLDPAVILKLIFLLFYENVKSERALMEQLPVRLDWLWFCNYDIDDQTPDHSVISKARRRWGQDVFADFFANILGQCVDAGLVDGKTIHIDSSMINANASVDSIRPKLRIVAQNIYNQLENQQEPQKLSDNNNDNSDSNINSPQRFESTTDPQARIGKKCGRRILGYKDHRVIDDKVGIVTGTITTGANINDGNVMIQAVEQHISNTGTKPDVVVADKAYGLIENYKYLNQIEAIPCIPHKEHVKDGKFSRKDFRYDEKSDRYICPGGENLKLASIQRDGTRMYRANRKQCCQCELLSRCITSKAYGRSLRRHIDAEYLDWADECLALSVRRKLMAKRKTKAEGSFADAANNHDFKNARWRGLVKIQIQNLVIAAVQNLRKLLRYIGKSSTAIAAATAKNLLFVRDYRLILLLKLQIGFETMH